MHPDIETFNKSQEPGEQEICDLLASLIDRHLPNAQCRIWHRHPVWFLDDNPTVGYSKLKAGIRLMFWSGASFVEEKLKPGTGKFKDASIVYTEAGEINRNDLKRWLRKSVEIQWDYKNIYKTKGRLNRLE